jgi:hypothetical protein
MDARRRRSIAKLVAGALACSLLVACDDEPAPLASEAQPIVYGEDDRVEVFAVDPDDPAAGLARRSVVAMVPRDRLVEHGGRLELTGPTWTEDRDLCPGVRFGDEPAIASCSAVLAGDDLVLTAGHCAALCASSKLVFGFYYDAPDALHPLEPSDVFDCVDVLADRHGEADDFAWLRLDRPAGPSHAPAPLRSEPPAAGEHVTLVGFPSGLPMKIDAGGSVSDAGGDLFHTSSDAFEGSSGSPLLDDDGLLLGVLGGGARDLEPTSDGCNVPVVADGATPGVERASNVAVALDALCDERPDEPLCGADGDPPAPSPGCSVEAPAAPRGAMAPFVLALVLSFARRRAQARPTGGGGWLERSM